MSILSTVIQLLLQFLARVIRQEIGNSRKLYKRNHIFFPANDDSIHK
jgi:hypothetical protein